jgi:hypothetical protein
MRQVSDGEACSNDSRTYPAMHDRKSSPLFGTWVELNNDGFLNRLVKYGSWDGYTTPEAQKNPGRVVGATCRGTPVTECSR